MIARLASRRLAGAIVFATTLLIVLAFAIGIQLEIRASALDADVKRSEELRIGSLLVFGATRPESKSAWRPIYDRMEQARKELATRHKDHMWQIESPWQRFSEALHSTGVMDWQTAATLQEAGDRFTSRIEMENRNKHRQAAIVFGIGILSIAGLTSWGFWSVKIRNGIDQARLQGERRFRLIFEHSSDAYFLIDDTGVIDCNEAAVRLLGFRDKRDIIGLQPSALSPERQPDGQLSADKRLELAELLKKKGTHRFEWTHRRADGADFPVEVSLTAVNLDDREVIFGVWHDLRERKQMEDALRAGETRLRDILEYLPAGVVHVDGERISINRAAEQLTGYGREELATLDCWFDSLYRDRSATVRRIYDQDKARGFPNPPIVMLIRKDDTVRHVQFAGYSYPGGEVWLLHDLTQRIEAQQARERLTAIVEATSDFVGVINPAGEVLYFNRAFRTALAFPSAPARRSSLHLSQFMSEQSCRILENEALPALLHTRRWRGEMAFLRANGTEIPVLVTAVAHTDKHTGEQRISAIAHDITNRKRAEEQLRRAQVQLEEAQRIANLGSWYYDLSTGEITWSSQLYNILGFDPDGDKPNYESVLDLYHPEDAARLRAAIQRMHEDLLPYELDLRRISDGQQRWYHAMAKPLIGEDGKLARVVGTVQDVTERKQTEQRLQLIQERLEHAQRVAQVGSWEYDPELGLITFSKEMYRLLDLEYTEEGPTYEKILSRYHPDDIDLHTERLAITIRDGTPQAFDIRKIGPDGQLRWMHVIAFAHTSASGEVTHLFGTMMDITERKRTEQQLEAAAERLEAANRQLKTLATTDGLTGLHNHRSFQERLAHEWARTQRYRTPFSLIMLDVDRFKAFNDLYGHPEGDTVLKTVAQILRTSARVSDHVSRYGGEEFVIVLPNTDRNSATEAAERFRLAIQMHNWPRRAITASLGVATLIPDHISAQDLLTQADRALYFSKQKGRNRVTHFNNLTTVSAQQTHEGETPIDEIVQEVLEIGQESRESASEHIREALTNAYDSTILSWSRLLDLRDRETAGHSARVAELMVRLARAFELDEEQIVYARWGALLHDVGKMAVPDAILHKPEGLNAAEWVVMQKHTTVAHEMLDTVPFLKSAIDIPYCHHEKWDGTGYPRGLKGVEIPFVARLFAVCDVYDALTSDRPYRKAWSKERTLAHLASLAGTHFDPAVVEMFLKLQSTSSSAADPLNMA